MPPASIPTFSKIWANNYYQKIDERYGSPGLLAGFYRRVGGQDPNSKYHAKLRALEKNTFPAGASKVKISDFQGPPKKGVVFTGNSASLRDNGISPSAIIVAIDGIKVESVEQYLFIHDASSDPNFSLIVYQNAAYQEIRANAEQRRFGVDIQTLE